MAQRVRTDWLLFLSIVGMVCFGLVMVYSASSFVAKIRYEDSGYYIRRQLLWAAFSFILMMLLKTTNFRRLNSPAWAFASIGVVFVLLIAVFFADPRAHRFLRLGTIGIQPSEFAKPALILFLAYFINLRAKVINDRHTLIPALLIIAPLAFAVVIGDLGTAIVLVATASVVFFVAGLKRHYFNIVLAVILAGVVCAVAAKPYRLGRVLAWVDPEYKMLDNFSFGPRVKTYLSQSSYTRDPGYHVKQSKIAVGTGGVLGQGLMNGKQKLLYLPEAHTDFIYAVVGEELGLVGSACVLAVFLLILWRGFHLARTVSDDFGRYIALGVTAMIVVQALINMSVVLGIGPTKGIPLPMISYGGSSLMSSLISLGMLLAVSEQSA